MSPQIVVHKSHRLEQLADELAEFVGTPLSDPLAKELIVVQGRGMALWLNIQLAHRLGVWANADYVYPKRFVRQIFSLVLGQPADDDSQDHYHPDALTWAVHRALLPSGLDPNFANLTAYRGDDPSGLRAFTLSEQIARCFDEYLTYRPQMLTGWEADARRASGAVEAQLGLFQQPEVSTNEQWQKLLWHELVERLGKDHYANLESAFARNLRAGRIAGRPPERISVFGLSSLPPQYVRVLACLANVCDVRLFSLDTARLSDADAGSETASAIVDDAASTAGLIDNSRTLGLEFERVMNQELRRQKTELRVETHREIESPRTLLEALQHDLMARGRQSESSPTATNDSSIRVHACHSMIREVEVLHDQLLALLDEGMSPDEILVMMPNVDDYAPLIEAVFKRGSDDPRFIPFRISDRKPQGGNPVLEALLRVLMLADRRCAASEVLDLLTLEPVRARFQIDATELEQITRWVVDSGIRWGIDAKHKSAEGVPQEVRNTWEFGFDRLVLGYAVDTEGQELVAGVLPYEHVEGKMGALLGRFVHFAHTLFSSMDDLAESKTIEQWQTTLGATIERLIQRGPDNAAQHQHLLSTLAALRASARAAEFEDRVSLQVVRHWIERHCEGHREAHGFLSGGVTFCAMVPMRSIPFRAICLLGMNDGEFPRATRRVDFNLLESNGEGRQAGDPDRRMDDRHLFLEALLSARERLLISYVGQSVRDNTKLAPSIVVTELLDELQNCHGISSESITVVHPLQPFSPRYFTRAEPELFSYQELYLGGASRLAQERRPPRDLFTDTLPPPAAEEELTLATLVEFFGAPTEHLLRRRLNLQVRGEHLNVSDREPAQLDALDDYTVGSIALAQHLHGVDTEHVLELSQASGQLPAWAPGERAFRRVMESVNPIAQAASALCVGGTMPPRWVSIQLDDATVSGELTELYQAGRVVHQYSRVKAKNLLQLWVAHLALCAAPELPVCKYSWLVGRPPRGTGLEQQRLRPVQNPERILGELVRLFQLGQTGPLRLFPEASLALARGLLDPKQERSKALYSANLAYKTELRYGSALLQVYGDSERLHWYGPENSDPEHHPNFEELSEQVFVPLLEHMEDLP